MLTIRCSRCKQDIETSITEEMFEQWKRGNALIQDMMSSVPVDERELLLSGMCGQCFDMIFAGDPD